MERKRERGGRATGRRRRNDEMSSNENAKRKNKLESHLGKHVLGDPGLFRRGDVVTPNLLPRRGDFLCERMRVKKERNGKRVIERRRNALRKKNSFNASQKQNRNVASSSSHVSYLDQFLVLARLLGVRRRHLRAGGEKSGALVDAAAARERLGTSAVAAAAASTAAAAGEGCLSSSSCAASSSSSTAASSAFSASSSGRAHRRDWRDRKREGKRKRQRTKKWEFFQRENKL